MRRFIPNYGERWRQGEPIATGFVESTVNAVLSKRFAKRQQMQWTPKGVISIPWIGLSCSLREPSPSSAAQPP